ncbi:MAG: tryptophan--tRNA ligase [Armatimonadetes bacterium]|nr:tryptophan--tRNA ligase [Armatimonadota bacterium]
MSDTNKKTIFSAMQVTGKLHLGNYEGALRNWVKLQDDYELYAGIVDLHSLTTTFEDTSQVLENVREAAIDYLAAGLDPEKTAIVVQSWVPAHCELHLLLSMITPVGWLERVPTYKEKREQLHIANPSYGLLGYPVLMAADILVYRADVVPVGRDQEPHLELTREIARRFNHLYGDIFPEPQSLLTDFAVLPGLDGRKMSKSYGNCIYLSDTADDVRDKVRTMFTDPEKIRKDDPGHPDGCPVFAYHQGYASDTAEQARRTCEAGELGCVAHKKQLTEILIAEMNPLWERRSALAADPAYVDQVLQQGAERARERTGETMDIVWKAMRLR